MLELDQDAAIGDEMLIVTLKVGLERANCPLLLAPSRFRGDQCCSALRTMKCLVEIPRVHEFHLLLWFITFEDQVG